MTRTSHEAPETYAREVRRHLPPLPRRARRALADAVERHLAEQLVAGRPAWLTIARLGPADRVAAALSEAWLEALDAGRTGRDHLRLAARGALVPAAAAAGVMGAYMLGNTFWLWHDLVAPAADPTWTLIMLIGMNVPAIVSLVLPFAAFYLGLGALQALARETSAPTRARLAPRMAGVLAAGGVLAALATFLVQDRVLVPANRAVVDTAVSKLGFPTSGTRSPQELTFAELRARLATRDGDPPDRLADGRILTPGEAGLRDYHALGLKVALPAAVATGTWSGLAWGAAFGLSRLPAVASGGLALVAGLVLGTTLTLLGWPPAWAAIAGSLLPLGLALPWLLARRRRS